MCISSLKIAHTWKQHSTSYGRSTVLNFDSNEFLPKQQGVRNFAEICTDYRNLPAFADKYSSKLAFWCQNTVRSLIVLSAQLICVQQMSSPKPFVHQRLILYWYCSASRCSVWPVDIVWEVWRTYVWGPLQLSSPKSELPPTTFYMHFCHHHLPHHRTTVLDSVYTHFSYLHAQHISLTVISWCTCCIKTPTRPIVFSLFYFTTFFLCYVLGIATVLVHSCSTVFLMFRCAFRHALFAIK